MSKELAARLQHDRKKCLPLLQLHSAVPRTRVPRSQVIPLTQSSHTPSVSKALHFQLQVVKQFLFGIAAVKWRKILWPVKVKGERDSVAWAGKGPSKAEARTW
ncbi:hypothetical protein JYU34_013100 [Plutella xylostella]|uniref:Uncharacterized protein n=1 Tax=Plutella xylostella TaxID=51655 RepID=A0ABQ7QCW8_PLUXY|nr:hypothetical protein JYU34_013100 [Plutella xylostella]